MYTAETCYSLHQNLRCKAAADAYTADTLFFFFFFNTARVYSRHSTPYTRICVTRMHVYTAETGYSLQRNLHRKVAHAYSRHAMAYTRIRVARIHVYTAETYASSLHRNLRRKNARVYNRKRLTAYGGIRVTRMDVYTAEKG